MRMGAVHDVECHLGQYLRRIHQAGERGLRSWRSLDGDGAVSDVATGDDAAIWRIKLQPVLMAPETSVDPSGRREPRVTRHEVWVDWIVLRQWTNLRKGR